MVATFVIDERPSLIVTDLLSTILMSGAATVEKPTASFEECNDHKGSRQFDRKR